MLVGIEDTSLTDLSCSISYPPTARTKKFLIEDEQKIKSLWDMRIAEEFKGDHLGEQFKGYVFKISGGTDKQGFAMMQGVLTAERVRLLLGEKHQCFNLHPRQKRKATRKRKSVRGCISSVETSVLNLIVSKKGDTDIPGLTDEASAIPNRLGPRRASKIRKLWNLEKTDDVSQYVIRRKMYSKKNPEKFHTVVPRVQRVVSPYARARAKRQTREFRQKRQKTADAKALYEKMLTAKREAVRSKRASKLSKLRNKTEKPAATKKAAPAKKAAPVKTAAKGKK